MNELSVQKKLRLELLLAEDVNAQILEENNKLRIEFEHYLHANELTVPLNREMKSLVSALEKHSHQIKNELNIYKKKYEEANVEVPKVKTN